MFRVYRREDGITESIKYRKTFFCTDDREIHHIFEVATGGDFRKGYITFDEQKFNEIFGDIVVEFKTHADLNDYYEKKKGGK